MFAFRKEFYSHYHRNVFQTTKTNVLRFDFQFFYSSIQFTTNYSSYNLMTLLHAVLWHFFIQSYNTSSYSSMTLHHMVLWHFFIQFYDTYSYNHVTIFHIIIWQFFIHLNYTSIAQSNCTSSFTHIARSFSPNFSD